MKDEFNDVKINEFVGLNIEVNKAKEVNFVLKHRKNFYVLFGKKVAKHKMKRILSEKHSVGTYDINKISLSCFDDKRYILDDGINTLAYGHKDIKY